MFDVILDQDNKIQQEKESNALKQAIDMEENKCPIISTNTDKPEYRTIKYNNQYIRDTDY